MLYNSKRKKQCTHLLVGGAMCLAGLAMFSCSDTYDLDSKQPSGLNTIYGYMEKRGDFKNFLQLIDDLGQKEILSKTGSKTLFPANDDAFAAFYASNSWGVHKYSDLTLAQKRLLLKSAMIDNPYPTSMLSTAEGPVKGEVCRRSSSQSLYDSVQVISTSSLELPQNSRWAVLRASHPDSIVLFKDASGSNPMVHFTPKFLAANKIESTDVDFLYNDPDGTRSSDDTYVNRSKILTSEFCKNGFVHVVDRVITPLDNMAEILRTSPSTTIFSSIIERFAAPDYSASLTNNYNINKGTEVDSVFIKRYYSNRSAGSSTSVDNGFKEDKDKNTFDASLKFDPGWNTYVPDVFNNRDAMMEDMGVIIAPTDDAIKEWWNNGSGKVIKDRYQTIENTPNSVLQELVNVNMLSSMVASVPSRFSTVLNDANDVMGLSRDAIDSVMIGCNGMVYLSNKVYAPTTYSSVMFPTVIDTENLNIIKNAIDILDYKAYLNSTVSRYSFFIPTNKGLLTYIDPVSYGQDKTKMWEFHFDATKGEKARIYADVYEVDTLTWEKVSETPVQKIQSTNSVINDQIQNRLEDLLDNIICVEEAKEGHHYLITKGKSYVKWNGNLNQVGSMTAEGGFQAEQNKPLTVTGVYKMENGYAYILDGVVMGSRRATSDILAETPEFSDFYNIAEAAGAFATSDEYGQGAISQWKGFSTRGNLVSTSKKSTGEDANYSLLNAYHYTVYAPTNEAMQIAYNEGLPTLQDLAAAEEYDRQYQEKYDFESDSAEHVRSVMRDFIRYHVQSNAIFADAGFSTGSYESAKSKLEYLKNDDNTFAKDSTLNEAYEKFPELPKYIYTYKVISGSPYTIKVTNVKNDAITIQDAMGNTAHLVTNGGNYNIMGREYWADNKIINSAKKLTNSSSVVVQAIDRPLRFAADQFKYVPRKIVTDEE